MTSSAADPYRSSAARAPDVAVKVTTRKQQNKDRARDAKPELAAIAREKAEAGSSDGRRCYEAAVTFLKQKNASGIRSR